jgi:tetratricopeptide (TPR) repeat protein
MIPMDVGKSFKIASRRFQNGNYLLSVKKYQAARKEFLVALTLFEKTSAYKETSETLNNIGVTFVKEGSAADAKAYFEKAYALKKEHPNGTKESLFNTIYNILGVGSLLNVDDFEKYFLELKALGEELGGEHIDIVKNEQLIYDKIVEARQKEQKKKEEEELARGTPAGALEHLMKTGMSCVAIVNFILQGFSLNISEPFSYGNMGKKVKLLKISPLPQNPDILTEPMSIGEIEFEVAYEIAKKCIDSAGMRTSGLITDMDLESHIEEEAYEHVKKFMKAIAMVREDLSLSLSKKNFIIKSTGIKNAFGEVKEIYHITSTIPVVPLTLTSEDSMLVNMLLTSESQNLYKSLLMNARRLLDEENYALCVMDSLAGFEAFIHFLLKNSLSQKDLMEYSAMRNPSLDDRLAYLKKLISGVDGHQGSMELYLGEIGRDLEDVIEYRQKVIGSHGSDVKLYEANKALKTVNRAVYNLKSLYGI